MMKTAIPASGVGRNLTKSNRRATPLLIHLSIPAMILWAVGATTISAAPVSLVLPQSTAFTILGHSCGGIQEKAYATGFSSANGYPTGFVYIQTRCGGSGRDGGGHVTTYSAWVRATWNWTGALVSSAKLSIVPPVNPTLSVTDKFGDTLTNSNGQNYLTVPVPKAPTGVTVAQSGDEAAVAWTPQGTNPAAITSSTLVATDVNSAAVVTSTVTGKVKKGLIGPLQPQTSYDITVDNTTIGGIGPTSAPVTFTTSAATVAPSAPTGLKAQWQVGDPSGTTDTIITTWNAAVPGNSPVDDYEVMISGSDGASSSTQTVSGTTLTAYFSVDFIPNWTVTVRAHNAAGWSPWSTPFTLGGL